MEKNKPNGPLTISICLVKISKSLCPRFPDLQTCSSPSLPHLSWGNFILQGAQAQRLEVILDLLLSHPSRTHWQILFALHQNISRSTHFSPFLPPPYWSKPTSTSCLNYCSSFQSSLPTSCLVPHSPRSGRQQQNGAVNMEDVSLLCPNFQ